MAPERARGEAFDSRADLFSAGLVLYSCLTAQSLFDDEAPTLLHRAPRLDAPITSAFRPSPLIAEPSAELLRKALALDPARRFATAKAFANKIRGYVTAGRIEMAALMPRLFPEQSRAAETISRGRGGKKS
jgi:serine/threonine protein kinase